MQREAGFALYVVSNMYRFWRFLYMRPSERTRSAAYPFYSDGNGRIARIINITATKYLDELVNIGMLDKIKVGRSNFYISTPLMRLFLERG
jgi:hypothetical protein